jgi:hypothetical protein
MQRAKLRVQGFAEVEPEAACVAAATAPRHGARRTVAELLGSAADAAAAASNSTGSIIGVSGVLQLSVDDAVDQLIVLAQQLAAVRGEQVKVKAEEGAASSMPVQAAAALASERQQLERGVAALRRQLRDGALRSAQRQDELAVLQGRQRPSEAASDIGSRLALARQQLKETQQREAAAAAAEESSRRQLQELDYMVVDLTELCHRLQRHVVQLQRQRDQLLGQRDELLSVSELALRWGQQLQDATLQPRSVVALVEGQQRAVELPAGTLLQLRQELLQLPLLPATVVALLKAQQQLEASLVGLMEQKRALQQEVQGAAARRRI